MKQIALLAGCLLALWGCTKEPDDACLPPPPIPIYIVLYDSTGRNLLDAPARYSPDNIRILFTAPPFFRASTPVPATVSTFDSQRALVLYHQSSRCKTSTFWNGALIQLDPTDTDTLTVEGSGAFSLGCRYNGQPIVRNAFFPDELIRVRK